MVEIDFHLLFNFYQTKEVYVCQMPDDQHFLIDLYANELWEVRKSYPKKYYDKRRKEWFDFEPVEFICRTEQFGSPNGYFRIELKPIIKTILEGRVEGMKQELKDTLTTLKAIDSELDRRNVDMMLKTLIKVKEKHLKELEKKVLKNEFCD